VNRLQAIKKYELVVRITEENRVHPAAKILATPMLYRLVLFLVPYIKMSEGLGFC